MRKLLIFIALISAFIMVFAFAHLDYITGIVAYAVCVVLILANEHFKMKEQRL